MSKTAASAILLVYLFCVDFGQTPQSKVESLPQYDLSIRLLPDEHRLEARGTIRLAATEQTRTEIKFLLSDLMRDLRVEVLEPAASAGAAKVSKEEQGVWTVSPLQPVPAGEKVTLRFSYSGGEGISTVFYLGEDGSFAGGLNTAWYPYPRTGRAPGVGTLNFSVPAGYSVVAAGVQLNSTEQTKQGKYKFEVTQPTFFGFAAGRYAVLQNRAGKVPISVYLLRSRSEWMEGRIKQLSKILDILSNEFGTYPYKEFSVVEVPSEQASKAGFSGASLDGFMLVNDYNLQNYTPAFFGHEMSHQWWGNLIKIKGQAGSYILGEGIAQYGSLRVVEILEGESAAAQYRRTGYPKYSAKQCAAGYFKEIVDKGQDHRLSDLPGSGISHLTANSKGFIVVDMLSRLVGRKRFSRSLQNLTRNYPFRQVTWEQFLQAIKDGTTQDVSWFYEQWFERTGAPDYQLTWRQKGKIVSGVITQPSPFYRATLEVEIIGANNRRMLKTAEIVGDKIDFNWRVPFKVNQVILDPHYKVLRWLPEFRNN